MSYDIGLRTGTLPVRCVRCKKVLSLEAWEHKGDVEASDAAVAMLLVNRRLRDRSFVALWTSALNRWGARTVGAVGAKDCVPCASKTERPNL